MSQNEISLPLSVFKDQKIPRDFICAICSEVVNPQFAVEHVACGKPFCKKCLDKWMKDKDTCPSCNQKNKDDLRNIKKENQIIFRLLSGLEVVCPSSIKSGICKWTGQWTDVAEHINACAEIFVFCKNECGCELPRKSIEQHEKVDCLKKPLPCKFCHEMEEFKMLEAHMAQCRENDEAMLECKYFSFGCQFKGKKTERTMHENDKDKEHLELAVAHFKGIDAKIGEIEKEIIKVKKDEKKKRAPCKVKMHPHPLVFVIKDNGWGCDGRKFNGGCRSGTTDFHQTKGLNRYRCDNCDFDLCEKCLDEYLIE